MIESLPVSSAIRPPLLVSSIHWCNEYASDVFVCQVRAWRCVYFCVREARVKVSEGECVCVCMYVFICASEAR